MPVYKLTKLNVYTNELKMHLKRCQHLKRRFFIERGLPWPGGYGLGSVIRQSGVQISSTAETFFRNVVPFLHLLFLSSENDMTSYMEISNTLFASIKRSGLYASFVLS